MTNADVTKLINHARSRGRELDEYQASVILAARELLQENPSNQHARTICENFGVYMTTGNYPRTFAEFMLPTNRLLTDEQRKGTA